MKILVTGALGVIGKPLCESLRAAGHIVFGTDRHRLAPRNLLNDYTSADVSVYREIENVLHRFEPEMVFHLAAEPGRFYGGDHFEATWSTNCIGLRNALLLQELCHFNMAWFSSSEVYGDVAWTVREDELEPATEAGRIRPAHFPLNDYGITKLAGEMMIRNSPERDRTLIVRPFMVYGQDPPSPYRSAVVRFLWAAMHNEPMTVYPGSRCWLHIQDFVATVARIPDQWASRPKSINIAAFLDSITDNYDLARMCCEVAGADESLILLDDRGDHAAKTKVADVHRAVEWLGHNPKTDLDEGLRLTHAWLRDNYLK